MNKALEQKLIGPMEESHTKEQSPKAVLWEVHWARRSKIAAKWARTSAWAGWWFFWEEEEVCGCRNKWRGATMGPRGRGTPCRGGRAPLARGTTVAPLHLFLHPHTSSSSQKNHHPAQARVLAHFAAIFDLLAQSTSHKTAWGIVPWYVTPPMVQLVFVLVLYSLQICAA